MLTTSHTTIESYSARVTANDDPEKRGRIRITCVGLLGDDETDLPMWVEPSLTWGWFFVPDVGEIIEIECVTGSAQDESQGQMSLDNLDIRWKGVRYYNEDEDVPTEIHPKFSEKNYGKRRGFATPLGHVFVFDDTKGDSTIALTWVAKEEAEAEQMTTLEIDKKGHVHLTMLNKHKIVFTPSKLVVTHDEGNALTLEKKEADATLKIGDGAVHATIVEHLETFWTSKVKPYIDNAFVNTGFGISSTIAIANPPGAPQWDPKINSKKVSFPDK